MCRQESSRKSDDYWLKIEKILKVLNVLVDCNEKAMDINQRLIGQELFREGVFE